MAANIFGFTECSVLDLNDERSSTTRDLPKWPLNMAEQRLQLDYGKHKLLLLYSILLSLIRKLFANVTNSTI